MSAPKLDIAFWDYDRGKLLRDGTVKIEGVDAAFHSCGAALYSGGADWKNLRLGAVKQRAELPPKSQGYCRSAMPWAIDISSVRRLD